MSSNAVRRFGAFAVLGMAVLGFAGIPAQAQTTTPPAHTYTPAQTQAQAQQRSHSQTLAYCENYARNYADSQTGDPGRSTVRGAGRGALIGGILDGGDGAGRGALIGGARGLFGSREGSLKYNRYYDKAFDRCMAAR